MRKNYDFTSGPILKPLLGFAVPVLLALLLQALYGAVDLWVVGHYATVEDIGGVTNGSMMMFALTHLVASFSMGATILIGEAVGEKKPDKAGDIVGTAIVMLLVIGVVLMIAIPLGSGFLARLLNTPEEAFPMAKEYIAICGGGMIMIIAYNLIGSIFRGIGDSVTPLCTVAIASVLNIIADVVLVKYFHMGAAGAAYATVGAQTGSVILSYLMIRRKDLPFVFSRKKLRFRKDIGKHIVRVGIPLSIQDIMVNISFMIIMAIVNNLGVIASDGIGVADRVNGFVIMLPVAMLQSIAAFTSQNKGAGKPRRALRGLYQMLMIAVGVDLAAFVVQFFFGGDLASLFTHNKEVVEATSVYLRAYALEALSLGFLFSFLGFFNGYEYTKVSMAISVSAAFLIRIPAAWLLYRFVGTMFGIGMSVPISTWIEIVIAGAFFLHVRRKLLKEADAEETAVAAD